MATNQIVLLDSEKYHIIKSVSNEWEIKWIRFYEDQSKNYYKTIKNCLGNVIQMSTRNNISEYIDSIIDIYEKKENDMELKHSLLIHQLLTSCILDADMSCFNKKKLDYNNLTQKIIWYIDENYTKNITVEELAKLTHFSVYYFCKIFKKTTGYSPHEYIINIKLHKSIDMLLNTDLSIEEIATQLGFEYYNSYSKSFKKIFDQSPATFRKVNKTQVVIK